MFWPGEHLTQHTLHRVEERSGRAVREVFLELAESARRGVRLVDAFVPEECRWFEADELNPSPRPGLPSALRLTQACCARIRRAALSARMFPLICFGFLGCSAASCLTMISREFHQGQKLHPVVRGELERLQLRKLFQKELDLGRVPTQVVVRELDGVEVSDDWGGEVERAEHAAGHKVASVEFNFFVLTHQHTPTPVALAFVTWVTIWPFWASDMPARLLRTPSMSFSSRGTIESRPMSFSLRTMACSRPIRWDALMPPRMADKSAPRTEAPPRLALAKSAWPKSVPSKRALALGLMVKLAPEVDVVR